MNEHSMARSFLAALRPLVPWLHSGRTISAGKMGVLTHLADHGRATTSELAAAGRISPQGISLSARELERSRLVVRVPDAEDRRRIWIELTDEGRQKLDHELKAGHARLDQAITERLTPEEQKVLEAAIPILKKLGSSLG